VRKGGRIVLLGRKEFGGGIFFFQCEWGVRLGEDDFSAGGGRGRCWGWEKSKGGPGGEGKGSCGGLHSLKGGGSVLFGAPGGGGGVLCFLGRRGGFFFSAEEGRFLSVQGRKGEKRGVLLFLEDVKKEKRKGEGGSMGHSFFITQCWGREKEEKASISL